jgi:hypothetical protein
MSIRLSPRRAVVLLFLVLGASVLDALCTLLFLQRGDKKRTLHGSRAQLWADALCGTQNGLQASADGSWWPTTIFPWHTEGFSGWLVATGLLLLHAAILLS